MKMSMIYSGITVNNAFVRDKVDTGNDTVYKLEGNYFIRVVEAFPTKKAFDSGHKPVLALGIFHAEEPYVPLFASHLGGEMSDWMGTEKGREEFDKEIDLLKRHFINNFNGMMDKIIAFKEDCVQTHNNNSIIESVTKEPETVIYYAFVSKGDKGMMGGIHKYIDEVPLHRESDDGSYISKTFRDRSEANEWLKDKFQEISKNIVSEQEEDVEEER